MDSVVGEKRKFSGSKQSETSKKDSKRRSHGKCKVDQAGSWAFPVDYNDHFETPLVAYEDVSFILNELATILGKRREELIIYDPYWCQGSMVESLKTLGFLHVINENKDFYADIRASNIPEYDILMTNPPYSGEHKLKLLNFLSTNQKPFALLLPAYISTKSYWKDFLSKESSNKSVANNSHTSGTVGSPTPTSGKKTKKSKLDFKPAVEKNNNKERDVIYVLPPDSYQYAHPEGTGKDIPPFYSAWFVGGMQNNYERMKTSLLTEEIAQRKELGNVKTSSSKKEAGKISRACSFKTSVQDIIDAGFVTAKRPNPRIRNKLKANKNVKA